MNRCAVAFVAFVAGCSVPGRDNTFDPSNGNYPIPSIVVRVQNPGDASPSVSLFGTRKTEFIFDASGSTVPTDKPVRFRWELDDPRWDAGDPNDFDTVLPDGERILTTRLRLTRAMLPPLGVGSVQRRVRLRIEVADGKIAAETSTDVVLQNSAPVLATPSEDWFIAPGDVPESIVVDACGMRPAGAPCRVQDADPGDTETLSYFWPGVVDEIGSGQRVRVELDAPLDLRGFELTFTASDGIAETTGVIRVNVGSPLWYSTGTPTRLYRHFPEFRVTGGFRQSNGLIAPLAAGLDALATEDLGDNEIWISTGGQTLRLDGGYVETQRWPVAAMSLQPSAGSGNACASAIDGIHALRFDGSDELVAAGNGFGPMNRVVAAESNGHSCWTLVETGAGELELGRLDQNSPVSYTAVATGLSGAFNGVQSEYRDRDFLLATRDGGAWMALSPSGPCPSLCRIPPDADSVDDLFSVDVGTDSLALDPDGTSVLAHLYSTPEFVRVFADGTVEPSTVLGLPPIVALGPTATDFGGANPTRGALWLSDAGGRLSHCRRLGNGFGECRSIVVDETAGVSASEIRGLRFDPDSGGVVVALDSPATGGFVAEIPTHMRRREIVEATISTSPHRLSADPTTGAVYYSDGRATGSIGFRRFSSGGVVLNTAMTFTPEMPDFGIDLVVGTRDGGAWVELVNDDVVPSDHVLVRVDGDLVETARYPLGARAVRDLAVSSDDQTVCIETIGSSTPEELLRVNPDGLMDSLGLLQFDSFDTRAAVSPSGGCWFAGHAPGGVATLLYFAPGATLPTETVSTGIGNNTLHIASDPRDESIWVHEGNGLAAGGLDRLFRVFETGVEGESFPLSVFALGLRSTCTDSLDPSCLEMWQLRSAEDGRLYRSDGVADSPLEVVDVSGEVRALTLRP